jgi:hypothetical protein
VLGGARRRCVRPGCVRRPATTLRFDYSARILTVDPLAPRGVPGEYDLCAEHAARTTPPSGWTMRDRAPSPTPAPEPSPPVGPARVHSADRLAAALSAVPRAVSEDAPDAAPVQADRQAEGSSIPSTTVVPARPAEAAAGRVDRPAAGGVPEQRSARLDALLRPSGGGTGGDWGPSRPAPQSLRLAPDPTTTVWCADLLATSPAPPPPVPPASPAEGSAQPRAGGFGGRPSGPSAVSAATHTLLG